MRRFIAALLCFTGVALSLAPASPAAADKQLQNMKGSVSYQLASGAEQPVATRGSVVLQDSAFAITGAQSLGGIVLPDSSTVLLGSSTRVQLVSFNQADIATANFVVASGKVRFKVMHPRGARANYTFQTPTAQIAVRGTTGDVDVQPNSLQVNVYELGDPSLPVQVTLTNGQVFTLHAGQSLFVHFGILYGPQGQANVAQVGRSTFQPFEEFGAPPNAAGLGLTTAAATAPLHAIITSILGAFVVNSVVHTIQHITAPHAPAPAPSPSVPVLIH